VPGVIDTDFMVLAAETIFSMLSLPQRKHRAT
jgi:hypothetical protein